MPEELFSYEVDGAALRLAQMMDSKLLLVTNVPDMNPEQGTSALQILGQH